MSTTALWDDLLVGDELAHLTGEPAREATHRADPGGAELRGA